jgi:hypothetical protein
VAASKRILLRSAKNPWDVVDADDFVATNLPGNNVGNLVFCQAVHRALSTSTVEVEANRYTYTAELAQEVNDSYDAFVVPLANAFRPNFVDRIGVMTEFIRQLKVPVVVVGVGAQAPRGRFRPGGA